MKTNTGCAFFFLVMFISVALYNSCEAQVTLEDKTVTIQADTMTVKEAFKLVQYMVPLHHNITKFVVYKDGIKYVQYNDLLNRWMKGYAYTERNGKVKLVRI